MSEIRLYDHEKGCEVVAKYDELREDDICPISMVNRVPSLCHRRCVWCPKELCRNESNDTVFDLIEDIGVTLAGIRKELEGIGR